MSVHMEEVLMVGGPYKAGIIKEIPPEGASLTLGGSSRFRRVVSRIARTRKWGAKYPPILSWHVLKDKTDEEGRKIFVLSPHSTLDYERWKAACRLTWRLRWKVVRW